MHPYLDIYEPAVLARAEALLDEIHEAALYEFSYGRELRRTLLRPTFQRLALEVLADEDLIEEKGLGLDCGLRVPGHGHSRRP